MGFNKRWINRDIIHKRYMHEGLDGVINLYNADAYILDPLGKKILELLECDKLSDIENLLRFNQKIAEK